MKKQTLLAIAILFSTTLQAQYFNGTSSTTSNIYRNGNVGIGISAAPTEKLEVGGDIGFKDRPSYSIKGDITSGVFSIRPANNLGGCFIEMYGPQSTRSGEVSIGSSNSGLIRFWNYNASNYHTFANFTPSGRLSIEGGMILDDAGHFDGQVNNSSENIVLKFGGEGSGEAIGSKRTATGNQNGLNFYTAYNSRMSITNDGKVTIGTVATPSGYKLYVEQGILTEQVKVAVKTTNDWSDYVFNDNYNLMPLQEVEKFIECNNHLPNVPSAEEVVSNGINMAKMDAKLLEKIEELTLYTIKLNKQVLALQEKVITLENKK